MRGLKDRVALVTGAARGIGSAIAGRLSEEGCALVLNDVDSEALAARCAELSGLGARAEAVPGSVADPETAEQLVERAVGVFADLHIVVTCAGHADGAFLHKMSDEQWFSMLDVHLTGTYRIVKKAISFMREKAKAEAENGMPPARKIITIASRGAFGSAGLSNYSAAKAGIIGFTRAVALEGARFNILANSIAFGMIDTRLTKPEAEPPGEGISGTGLPEGVRHLLIEQTPLRRPGRVEEAAGAAAFLASDDSSYITGQVLHVNGGSRI